jgi:hypothetical protein
MAAYGALVRNRWYVAGSVVTLVGWAADLSGRGYRELRTSVAGLDEIALGLACLLVGFLLSLWKLGMPQTWINFWLKRPIPAVPAGGIAETSHETPP